MELARSVTVALGAFDQLFDFGYLRTGSLIDSVQFFGGNTDPLVSDIITFAFRLHDFQPATAAAFLAGERLIDDTVLSSVGNFFSLHIPIKRQVKDKRRLVMRIQGDNTAAAYTFGAILALLPPQSDSKRSRTRDFT